jgi:hypothetical protein
MRTPQDLQDELDSDLAWRRVEAHSLLSSVRATRGSAQQAAIRAGIALLYAHWEGYTKNALTRYLEFVSRRKLRLRELNEGLAGLAADNELRRRGNLSDSRRRTALVRLLASEGETRASLPNGEVNTQGNLNSDLCSELFECLGLDYSALDTKKGLIDYSLLRVRNDIAHGRWMSTDRAGYEELHGEVMTMLVAVRNAVMNATDNSHYRRSSSPGTS